MRHLHRAIAAFVVTWFTIGSFAQESLPQTRRASPLVVRRVPLLDVPLVFVSRQIPDRGSIYWNVPNAMPGVGPHSRMRPAAPGQLLLREAGGRIRRLVDGANPTPQSLNLIDVNAPAVSYDGQTIVFAGLPQGNYDDDPGRSVGAWRLYAINADGSNVRQITFSDRGGLDYAQFGAAANGLRSYDDFDPVFLPDGRICFASTRYPAYAQYSGVRASNLYVVNLDGTRLHRITAERNGADRPLIDPSTGRIVYARWWRNHRFPIDDMTTIPTVPGPAVPDYDGPAYIQHEGLTMERDSAVGGPSMFRNAWQAARINTDGTGLIPFTMRFRNEDENHHYGGGFSPGGVLFSNYFPMANMTEAAGFGGIRKRFHGQQPYLPLIGITYLTLDYVHPSNPTSFGIFNGDYAGEPEVLPDGRVVISWCPDVGQDYGLYLMDSDGTGLTPLYDRAGTSELRARVLTPRPTPPILPDMYRDNPSLPFAGELPPDEDGPYDIDGTFTFACFNIYANGGVDQDMTSAPAVGSAASIRFFIDHQRQSPGSFPHIDWPILLDELPIAPDGSVIATDAPANVSLFEQLRGPASDYRVPLTGGPYPDGAGHVTGMNFAPSGAVASCVGCHAGHSAIPVPVNTADAAWSNLAPGASIEVSSSRDHNYDCGLIDRRAAKGEIWRYWTSAPGQQAGQWVRLTFAVPVSVRTVRLYNPRFGDEADSTIQVQATTVILFSDAAGGVEVARAAAGPIEVGGTDVQFADVVARSVRINLDAVTGRFYGALAAGLAEVEIIARGEAP